MSTYYDLCKDFYKQQEYFKEINNNGLGMEFYIRMMYNHYKDKKDMEKYIEFLSIQYKKSTHMKSTFLN